METAIWVLIIALFVILVVSLAFFFFRYTGGTHNPMPQCIPVCNDIHSSSMAGHILDKMKNAERHARRALHYSNKASAHSHKAAKHASGLPERLTNPCNPCDPCLTSTHSSAPPPYSF